MLVFGSVSDRLNENAHSQLLQLYSITGQRTAAISLYKHYKELLSRELGIEPTEEMTALYQADREWAIQLLSAKHKVNTPVFLIADIEKATLYWARAGDKKDRYPCHLHQYFQRNCPSFRWDYSPKTEDNITLLFENGQPLHCAVTIHLKLKKADWGELWSTQYSHGFVFNHQGRKIVPVISPCSPARLLYFYRSVGVVRSSLPIKPYDYSIYLLGQT